MPKVKWKVTFTEVQTIVHRNRPRKSSLVRTRT
jgi:hypothetical protein